MSTGSDRAQEMVDLILGLYRVGLALDYAGVPVPCRPTAETREHPPGRPAASRAAALPALPPGTPEGARTTTASPERPPGYRCIGDHNSFGTTFTST